MLTTSLCLMQGVLYELFIGFMFVVLFLSVFSCCYVRQTKLASSLDNVWAHYEIVIVWLTTDTSISKSFLCHHCVVLYTVYVFYVRTAPVRSQHVAPRCTLHNSRPRLLLRLPLPIPTLPELYAASTGACLCLSSSSLLLLLLSTRGSRDSVWAPTEWLTARRNCRRPIGYAPLSNRDKQDLIRLSFSTLDFFLVQRMCNPLQSV